MKTVGTMKKQYVYCLPFFLSLYLLLRGERKKDFPEARAMLKYQIDSSWLSATGISIYQVKSWKLAAAEVC